MSDTKIEPTITVNGTTLTTGQAMTVRVALESFALDLRSRGLGDDDHGVHMARGYLAAIKVIHALMHSGWRKHGDHERSPDR